MRISFVNQDRGIDPARKKGAAVHVRAMRAAFERLGATVLPVDESSGRRVRERLLQQIEEGGLDLIYERYSVHGYAASQLARARGIPHVLEVNAPLTEEARRFRPSTELPTDPERERSLFGGAHVVAVSQATAAYARARGARPDRVSVMPNAVDPELFRPRRNDDLRDRHVPPGRFVLGVHGRFRPWHNFPLLVRATRRLIDEGAPVFLMVVGYGDGVELLEGLPAESCAHLPWCSHAEVAALVACFDALPLTYAPQADFYFSPLKLVEAMACGVVPVVPRLGDLPERVVDDETGVLYDAGDEEQLVDALLRLIEDPARTGRMRAGAIAAASGSTWLGVARQVLGQVVESPR